MSDKQEKTIDIIDDGTEDLFYGFWPLMRRIVVLFLPVWVILFGFSLNLNIFITAILAGSSISLVLVFEKINLIKQE